MNESYLHDQRTKSPVVLLDKFLAARRHVSIALISVGLFGVSLNAFLNRLPILSYDTVRDSTQNLTI